MIAPGSRVRVISGTYKGLSGKALFPVRPDGWQVKLDVGFVVILRSWSVEEE